MLAGRLPSQGNGLADPRAEGIHKDTDGPDQASDSVEYFAHLPGRYLALADFCASPSRLGHGPHLLPTPSSPARTCVFREKMPREASPIMPTSIDSPSRTPQHGDSAARQSPLRTPASSTLVPRASWSPTRSDGRGHSTRPGACPSGRGPSTPSGTGLLTPYAQHVPGRKKVHLYAQDAPGRGKDAMWTVRNGAARDSRVVRLA